MPRTLKIVLATIVACLVLPPIAGEAAKISEVGSWRLVSMIFVDEATGKTDQRFGEKPEGYLIFSPGGHMAVVINAAGRQPVASLGDQRVQEQARLFSTMTAHAGTYTLTGPNLVHRVAVAHDPAMVGGDLLRHIEFSDNDRMVSTTPAMTAPDGTKYKVVLTWRRVE